MTDSPGSYASMALAEEWLAAETRFLPRALPPALCATYEAGSRQKRSRSAGLLTVVGVGVTVLFYLLLMMIAPELRQPAERLMLGVLLPAQLVCGLYVLANPPPVARELALALPGVLACAIITMLFYDSPGDRSSLYLGSIVLCMLFSTVSLHLRFSIALLVIVLDSVLFGVGMGAVPSMSPAYRLAMVLMNVMCGGYMLLANWRMHLDGERAYVYALRERLRRDALSQRNLELTELASRDALTGLANRRAYDSWLHAAWHQAAAAGTPLGLIIADIDWFKLYNDFYGHPAGDACLQSVARCLQDQLRGTTDQVARVGGEEFAIVLAGVGLEPCGDIAERLRLAVANLQLPHLGVGTGRMVGVSFGVASLLPAGSATPQTLMESADCALYAAKQAGRDCVYLAGGTQSVRRPVAAPPLAVPD